MIINSRTRHWDRKEDEIAFKRNQRFNFRSIMALESFSDERNEKDIFKNEVFKLYEYLRDNQYELTDEKALELSKEISQKFNDLFDKLGREHFIFYDDGDVNYIWELDKKDKK